MKKLISTTVALTMTLGGVALALGGMQPKPTDTSWQLAQGNVPAYQRGQGRHHGNGNREPVFMDGWDDDGNGVVTLEEANERRIDLFDALDENEDGQIVAREFTEFLESQKEPDGEETTGKRALFGMTLAFNDTNKDGFVTKAEFISQTQAWLSGMDRNRDGKVSKADFGPRGGQGMGRGQGRDQGRGQGKGIGRGQGRGQGGGKGQGQGWRFQQQG